MNMNVSPEDLDSVCEGCLSPDRPDRTVEVTDLEIKKLYYEILNIVENVDNVSLRLCGECKANILKYVAFKKQVIEAHEVLNKYLLKSSQGTSTEFASTFIEPDAGGPAPPRAPAVAGQAAPRGPRTFLNIGDNADDADEYFVDDGCSRDGVDDTDLTAVLKPDLISPNNLKLRVSHKNKRNKDDDFDASDDEPLNKKRKQTAADPARGERGASGATGERAERGARGDRSATGERAERGERGARGERAERGARGERSATGERGETKKTNKKRKKGSDAAAKPGAGKARAPRPEKPPGVVDTPRVRRQLEQLNVPRDQLQMIVLSWPEVEAERQRALASEKYTRHAYRCADCALGFNHRSKLLDHMKKHDPGAGALWCAQCRVRCRTAHALSAHTRRHRVRWRCVWCGATSSRAGVAADHLWRTHGGVAPQHRCQLCGAVETSLTKLRNHMRDHSERQKCEQCGKTFRDRTSLRTHLFIHRGEKEFACPRCEKRFLFKKAMEVHLVTHDASALLYCYECDLNFKNRISYKQHRKYSLKHVDPAKLKHACSACDKKFLKASRLEEHTLAVHLKATPISCTLPGCSFVCSSRPVLRTHVRMLHRGGRAVRNHVCHKCGKTYMTKMALEGHLRSHTGERPFSCAHCAATFGYEAALYNHNKLVHGKGNRMRPAAAAPAPPVPAPAPPAATPAAAPAPHAI